MKAALLVEPGRIELAEVPDPNPGPGELQIAVRGVGLCGSDLSVFSGRWQAPSYPWIMGHEAFGVVEAVGPGVAEDRLGQTVVVEPNVVCFVCALCESGRTSACASRQSIGMNRPGALAEKLVVPSAFAWPAPAVDATDLVCVEPTTVAVAGLRRAGDPLPDEVSVVGVGALGLLVTLVLRERGAEVYAVDTNPDRARFAAELGAGPAGDGKRFDLVVDTVGSPASIADGLARVAVGGTLLLLGLDSRPFELDAQTLVRGQVTLTGSLTYDHPRDFESALDMIASGRLRPGRVVTAEYPLERAQEAFESVGTERGKTWIRVGSSE